MFESFLAVVIVILNLSVVVSHVVSLCLNSLLGRILSFFFFQISKEFDFHIFLVGKIFESQFFKYVYIVIMFGIWFRLIFVGSFVGKDFEIYFFFFSEEILTRFCRFSNFFYSFFCYLAIKLHLNALCNFKMIILCLFVHIYF